MKKYFLWFGKAFIAIITAFLIITVFCFFYCNYPSHYTTPSKSTDYYWDKNALSIRGTEGFALSRTDDNGYVNTYPNIGNSVDVLLMGSSHTEGFNVNETENYAYNLNKLLNENGLNMYAYNIAVSGHTMSHCLNNLDNAVSEYKPSEYVFIETNSLEIPLDELQKLDDGSFERLPSYDSGWVAFMQKSDFIRQMYAQFNNLMNQSVANATEEVSVNSNTSVFDDKKQQALSEYEYYLDKAIKKVKDTADKSGCKIVIMYIPNLGFDYYGNVVDLQLTEKGEIFETLCQKYDVPLINMYSAFAEMYINTNNLPQGFSNTAVGKGHINKYGHSVIAEELCEFIMEENK